MMRKRLPVLLLVSACLGFTEGACDFRRMSEQESVRPYEQEMPPVVPAAVPRDGGENRYRLAPSGTLKNPATPGPVVLDRGARCYGFFCVQCHGSRLNGDGTVGQSFNPLPANLRSARVQALSDDALFRSISYGSGRHPPLAETVAVEDRWCLIDWVRSLGPEKEAATPVPSGDFARSAEGLR
jgi:mono/diheme cytochrome c family protein